MGMEGDPRRAGHESRGMIHRAADRAPAASGAARPPMSLDELDRWLRAPRQRKPAADGIAMLDGFVAAIVAGPATYEPLVTSAAQSWLLTIGYKRAPAISVFGVP